LGLVFDFDMSTGTWLTGNGDSMSIIESAVGVCVPLDDGDLDGVVGAAAAAVVAASVVPTAAAAAVAATVTESSSAVE